jgi:hypothetical protein
MKNFRFTLEHYKTPSSRFTCPSCGQKKRFTRYIDIETRQHLADNVGRCDREQNCGYHYTPKQYFIDHPDHHSQPSKPVFIRRALQPKLASLISSEIVQKSMNCFWKNNFVTYLLSIFDKNTVDALISRYHIGTSKNWSGAVIFWQVDFHGKVRTGKIMLYDSISGHRVKKPFNHISWVHSVLKIADFNLQQCFFGEHLLNLHPDLPVAIVESEKTAIIASVYFPEFIWIATGGKNGCKWNSGDVCKVLQGYKVILWTDVAAFDNWYRKAQQLKLIGLQVEISDLLERKASEVEKKAGFDIADFLIRFPINQFRRVPESQPP